MLRGMVFVDHMNFDIAIRDYYLSLGLPPISLDYNTLFKGIVSLFNNIDYTKTFIFAPEPDAFLKNDPKLLSYYKWIQGLKSSKYLDIIEGRYIARPVNERTAMDINDKDTYYKVEKGTDINLAIHAVSKAQSNAYDVAFIMSADTDYINMYRLLKSYGKIVIVIAVHGQNLGKIKMECDDFKILDKFFFEQHIRKSKSDETSSFIQAKV